MVTQAEDVIWRVGHCKEDQLDQREPFEFMELDKVNVPEYFRKAFPLDLVQMPVQTWLRNEEEESFFGVEVVMVW